MINVNLKSLVEKMNPTLRSTLEEAAGLCLSRSQYSVEIEHWLIKLLEQEETDLKALCEVADIDLARLTEELTRTLEHFKTGNTRAPSLSPAIVEAAQNAWMLCSVECGHTNMSSAHLLTSLLLNDTSRRQLFESSRELQKVKPESLATVTCSIVGTTQESKAALNKSSDNESPCIAPLSQTPALDQFTINLTEKAQQGEIDPVLGRDEEIRQCIDILSRRRQNNPIMTGEAGVGKTAVVEGFALRIAEGDVPDHLQGVAVRTLDLGLLQAGASVKGEFENRLNSVIEEVKSSPQPIILFIDEAHTLIGAGGKEGQGDAANLLKPALARGELRTIAATTWAEYKKYFERDPALTRRFQVIKIEEPEESVAIDMMRGIAESLQAHHKVRISEKAIEASVKLSARYIPNRQLPDKSVSLLDTACARVALSQTSTPATIEDLRRRQQQIETHIRQLTPENAATGEFDEALQQLEDEKLQITQDLTDLQTQFREEQTLVAQISEHRNIIEDHFKRAMIGPDQASADQMPEIDLRAQQQRLRDLYHSLEQLQNENPLIHPEVDAEAVAEVIASWTGIPIGKMVNDEIAAIMTLKESLQERVIGQDHALDAIARVIRTSRAGLTDPRKPIGVFLMVGTSGVGKTETALALADSLFGGEGNMTTINMSEFKEEHKVSLLLGSPPGYVGYGEGGILTEAVRRKPYSVILLDEMEKAHPGVQDIFYNLFDKGTIKDGEGRDIDFKNCVIIMTSNAAEDSIRTVCEQSEVQPEPDELLEQIRPALLQHFKPAFLGRTQVVSYYPLNDENLLQICRINMKRVQKRVETHYGAMLSYDEDLLLQIAARSREVDTGARNIETLLNRTLLPELAAECLHYLAEEREIEAIHVGINNEGRFSYQIQ